MPNKTLINQSHISALPYRDVNLGLRKALRPRPGTGGSVLLLIKMDYGWDYGLSPPKVRSKLAERQLSTSLRRETDSFKPAKQSVCLRVVSVSQWLLFSFSFWWSLWSLVVEVCLNYLVISVKLHMIVLVVRATLYCIVTMQWNLCKVFKFHLQIFLFLIYILLQNFASTSVCFRTFKNGATRFKVQLR